MLDRLGKADSLTYTRKDMDKLLRKMKPRIRKAFEQAIARARSTPLSEISDALQAGRLEQTIRRASSAAASAIAAAANAALIDSGIALATALTDAFGVTVSFDQTNTRAVKRMQDARLRMIQEFTEEQRVATRHALVDGVRRGLNPREQARNFRESIGLTSRQEAAVSNYRRLLTDGSREALTRQLRDRRFDATVERAASGDIVLTGKQVETMVGRYRDRYIKYRSEVIARTESLRSVHEGTEEMVEQGIEDNVIDPDSTERSWVTAKDGRVRDPAHVAMEGQTQPIGQPFTSGNGNLLRFPGDPDAPAAEIIQCRCVVTTRITSLAP